MPAPPALSNLTQLSQVFPSLTSSFAGNFDFEGTVIFLKSLCFQERLTKRLGRESKILDGMTVSMVFNRKNEAP